MSGRDWLVVFVVVEVPLVVLLAIVEWQRWRDRGGATPTRRREVVTEETLEQAVERLRREGPR